MSKCASISTCAKGRMLNPQFAEHSWSEVVLKGPRPGEIASERALATRLAQFLHTSVLCVCIYIYIIYIYIIISLVSLSLYIYIHKYTYCKLWLPIRWATELLSQVAVRILWLLFLQINIGWHASIALASRFKFAGEWKGASGTNKRNHDRICWAHILFMPQMSSPRSFQAPHDRVQKCTHCPSDNGPGTGR